mmetsp:Transcript_10587/g.28070  ORF Transcript_10587/g.28070 Transcript_10587/m.28070 type:complete len:245 (+) Transcript_10587:388-1122(+)
MTPCFRACSRPRPSSSARSRGSARDSGSCSPSIRRVLRALQAVVRAAAAPIEACSSMVRRADLAAQGQRRLRVVGGTPRPPAGRWTTEGGPPLARAEACASAARRAELSAQGPRPRRRRVTAEAPRRAPLRPAGRMTVGGAPAQAEPGLRRWLRAMEATLLAARTTEGGRLRRVRVLEVTLLSELIPARPMAEGERPALHNRQRWLRVRVGQPLQHLRATLLSELLPARRMAEGERRALHKRHR